MIVKTFLTGWIWAIVAVYAHSAALAGFCSASSCNLSNVSVMPDITLALSPKSTAYLKLGSYRIVIAEFPVEIDFLKNLNNALSARYVDCIRLKEQLRLAKTEY
jgi:hypothetical protein